MELNCLVKLLRELYEENNKTVLSYPYVINLLENPTEEQKKQLEGGKGNPAAETSKINSSAGMAFNYYKLFEKAKGVIVEFEWKESIPLTKSTAPANIDVRYETNDGTIYFVECKYLEPYYQNYTKNREAYFDTNRYPFENNHAEWKDLLEKEDKFEVYDVPQLFRHMLAIYRHSLTFPDIYSNKKIVLKSVIWKMSDEFLERYNKIENNKNKEKNRERLAKLFEEKERAETIINEFSKKICWNNFTFESQYYNDIIDDIKGTERYGDFLKQYSIKEK